MKKLSSENKSKGKIGSRLVSLFGPLCSEKGSATQIEEASIADVLAKFKRGEYRTLVDAVRRASSDDERRLRKKKLPSMTPAGVFRDGLKEKSPNPFSGLIQVDIDKVDDIKAVREKLEGDEHIYACMLSPSGNGVKGLISVPLSCDCKLIKNAVINYFKTTHCLTVDPGPCALNARFFVTYDPELYLNDECHELDVEKYATSVIKKGKVVEDKIFNLENKLPLDEIRGALKTIPSRPDYNIWIELTNAVREAAGTKAAEEILIEWSPEETPGEYQDKMYELPLIRAERLFQEAYRNGWRPCVYFENETNNYWIMDAASAFRRYTGSATKNLLASYELDESQIDAIMHKASFSDTLDIVLNVAGMAKGLHVVNGKKLLVPNGPNLVTPSSGDWGTIRAIFQGMLGDAQYKYFIWWLAASLKALYSGRWQAAQVLAFVGPTSSGKSLTQCILTLLFGKKQTRVMQSISGDTSFNGDWAKSPHLVIEDEFSDNSKATRDRIKEKIKAIAVNRSHRIHPKGKEAIEIAPFWRLTISCNPQQESLAVLPHLDESAMDKISLLETQRFKMPMPARTQDEKDRLWQQIEQEAPALIHDLLKYEKPPAHLRDNEGRFDLSAYHNPSVRRIIEEMSPELDLLNNIMDAMEEGKFAHIENPLSDIAERSQFEITVSAADVYIALQGRGMGSYTNSKLIGRRLSTLARIRPEHVRIASKSESNGHKYRIIGNGAELL